MKYTLFTIILIGSIYSHISGQKSVTLEDIWTKGTFYTKTVPEFRFMKDGTHYSKLEDNKIVEYDLISGKLSKVILNGDEIKGKSDFMGSISNYAFSPNEDKIIIASETENIYRRSTISNFHIVHLNSGIVSPLYPQGKTMHASFSPGGSDVAFVYENNLFTKNLPSGLITQITFDGKKNEIINGTADWAYEEAFSMSKAFFWSPKGDQIVYLKFDESRVKEYIVTKFTGEPYPVYEKYKYPKTGEDISRVTVHLFSLETGKNTEIQIAEFPNNYIPQITWTAEEDVVAITSINRHQNHLKLYQYNVTSKVLDVLLEERNDTYIDVHNHLTFLPDRKNFIWSDDESGFNRLSIVNIKSKKKDVLTHGDYEVTDFYGYDPKTNFLFFQSTVNGPQDRQICKIDLDGQNFGIIKQKNGWNEVQFSSSYEYYVLRYSNFNSPPTFSMCDKNGNELRVIEDNDHLRTLQKEYASSESAFFELVTSDNVKLNGWMIKPIDFDPNKKYPLFMYVYGGPGSQEVTDRWKGDNYWWFELLASKGYIVACVDGRGTGGKGTAFRKSTYLQLGHYETIDQIEGAMFLGRKPYVDAQRIGIFGWSYGGFIATNALLKGSEIFNAAIAVSPVTHWKWYNAIFTERYMKTIMENPDGYRLNAPVNYATKLQGAYLLVHGTGDDNVHFQHSAEMMKALILANKQYDNYSYPNRNHGIYGENARLHLFTKMTNFIIENI